MRLEPSLANRMADYRYLIMRLLSGGQWVDGKLLVEAVARRGPVVPVDSYGSCREHGRALARVNEALQQLRDRGLIVRRITKLGPGHRHIRANIDYRLSFEGWVRVLEARNDYG